MRRDPIDAAIDKRKAIDKAEEQGLVADSIDVRIDLINRMKAGEFDLAELQRRLAAIKRGAKRNGMQTRSQIWRQS